MNAVQNMCETWVPIPTNPDAFWCCTDNPLDFLNREGSNLTVGGFICWSENRDDGPTYQGSYKFVFGGVYAFRVTDLGAWYGVYGEERDLYNSDEKDPPFKTGSLLNEVVNSPWLKELDDNVPKDAKHFAFVTDEQGIDVIATGFELDITGYASLTASNKTRYGIMATPPTT
ncbi:MAG: hypothetical protein JWL77_4102 [Chthonomonadaceae bacterium]|nr:hypothetical protein [Chthonomonadaceae bacterium]